MKRAFGALALALLAGCAGPASGDEALLARARKAGVPWEADDIGGVRPASPLLRAYTPIYEVYLSARELKKWPRAELQRLWLAEHPQAHLLPRPARVDLHSGTHSLVDFLSREAVREAKSDPPKTAQLKLIRARKAARQLMAERDMIFLIAGIELDAIALNEAAARSGDIDLGAVLAVPSRPEIRHFYRVWSWIRIQHVRNAREMGGIQTLLDDRRWENRSPMPPWAWLMRHAVGNPPPAEPPESRNPWKTKGWPELPSEKQAMRAILEMDALVLSEQDGRILSAWAREEKERESRWDDEAVLALWSPMSQVVKARLIRWIEARSRAERALNDQQAPLPNNGFRIRPKAPYNESE